MEQAEQILQSTKSVTAEIFKEGKQEVVKMFSGSFLSNEDLYGDMNCDRCTTSRRLLREAKAILDRQLEETTGILIS